MKTNLITMAVMMTLNTGFAQELKTFHDFKTLTLEGKEFDLSSLKGKKVLVINTASLCGYTPQYKDLQLLFEQYGGEKFTVIGFPANNFGKQEPGSNEEIGKFCEKNYGVTFPMMHKISVKGDDIDPIYEWLTQKKQNGVEDAKVAWNFQKFLIDENGKWIKTLSSKENPMSENIVNWIK